MKNRFGPIDEVGCFDLAADGITAVTDPTGLFVENHHQQVAGTCVAVTMEGRRPMLAEVQALVTPTAAERPRRTTSGLDSSRVAMVLAVLQQHCGIRLHAHDVFASTVGGARLVEPASDLAVAVALASANAGSPAPAGRRGDGRDRPGRRAAPGPRPAAAARRGGPARVPGRRGAREPDASGPAAAATARSTACGSSTCPTSPPRCGCSGSSDAPRDASAPPTRDRSGHPRRTTASRSPRLTPRPQGSAAEGGDGVVGTDRSDETLRLRATLASIAPGTDAARRAGADPARPHRRPDRARPRQDRRVDLDRRLHASTSRSPPPACASWPRWTARSSSTRTSPGSSAPPST